MRLVVPLRATTLILVIFTLTAGNAEAQPSYREYWTVEARIARADHVVVGVVDKVVRKVIVAPGAKTKTGQIDPNGRMEYTFTVKISEVLKGDLKETVDDLRVVRRLGFDDRYEEWSKAQTAFLWFLGPTPKAGKKRSWDHLALGKPVPAERRFGGRSEPPVLSVDFSFLNDERDILDRARAFARTSVKKLPIHSIRIPGAVGRVSGLLDYLMVPVDPALEKQAKRLIRSPEEFVTKGKELDPMGRYLLRFGGVDALRYFKSDANARLLCSLLDDPPEDFKHSLVPQHPVRARAFEILLHWNVEPPLPKSA
jgi:hypothetical protein